MKLLRNYISFFSGFALQILAMWLEWLDNVELLRLQKIFYLSSIILIWIGIIQVLFRARAKSRRRKKWLSIDNLADTQQAKKIVELAKNPSKKGEMIVETFHLIQKGGNIVKSKLLSLTWVQILSLAAAFVLFALGVGTAFVPELAPVAEYTNQIALAVGIAVIPGIFSKGKDVGAIIKSVLPKKEQKEIAKRIKEWQKKGEELAKQYAPIIKLAADIKELGGALTSEQATQYNTYLAQEKALKAKIDAEKKKLEAPTNG